MKRGDRSVGGTLRNRKFLAPDETKQSRTSNLNIRSLKVCTFAIKISDLIKVDRQYRLVESMLGNVGL